MSEVILKDATIIKAKILTTIPFFIAWLLSIPIGGIFMSVFGLKITTANQYFSFLFLCLANFVLLEFLFTGKLNIEIDDEKDLIKLEWNKKPIYTKIEDQIILLSDVKNWKLLDTRLSAKLRIFLKDGSVIKMDFNAPIDFGKNLKKKDQLLRFLTSKNINSVKN